MKRILSVLISGFTIYALAVCLPETGPASAAADKKPSQDKAHGLALSDMQVKITSRGRTATFQLYNTVAAKQFYDQLPLKLDLTNFRDAQWMFYPPAKLSVTAREAYHDGKRGELSYYGPWGDVFMLYKDFHASDKMHRLGISLAGTDEIAAMSGSAIIEKNEPNASTPSEAAGQESARGQSDLKGGRMKIRMIVEGITLTATLDDNRTAKDLFAQLPMTLKLEDYASTEKISYLPRKLSTQGAPPGCDPSVGAIAYYAPWGNLALFYRDFGYSNGLVKLGSIDSGVEALSRPGPLRVTIELTKE